MTNETQAPRVCVQLEHNDADGSASDDFGMYVYFRGAPTGEQCVAALESDKVLGHLSYDAYALPIKRHDPVIERPTLLSAAAGLTRVKVGIACIDDRCVGEWE